jgi:DNA-binding NtrC family response regulator
MTDILIVDDDADLARTLAEVLELYGHSTRLAFNGEEGLGAMAQRPPDLILLDIEMPVLDGPSMAYKILVHDAGMERIPIIVSSGYSDIEQVAARMGTPYAVKKPCTVDDLIQVVDRATRERRAPQPMVPPTSGAEEHA